MALPPLLLERFYDEWEFAAETNLSASDPEPLTLQELLGLADPEVRDLWDRLVLGYIQPHGQPLLRREIAQHYRGVDPSDVTLTTGAQEAIYLLARTLAAPRVHAVAIAPAYQVLYEALRVAGADVSLVDLDSSGGWSLHVDAVLEAVRDETELLILNFPHNPTGAHLDVADYQRLFTVCEARGIRIISDEVFRGIEYRPQDRLPAAVELSATAVSIGDLSKSYGLAGLRVGWIACKDPEVLEMLGLARDYTTIGGNGLSHVLGITALRSRERLQQRARSIVAENLELVAEFFARYPDRIQWLPPRAGTTAFPRLLGADVEQFCRSLATEEGVLLAPGSLFETTGGYFRLGLGHRDIQGAFPALERAFASV